MSQRCHQGYLHSGWKTSHLEDKAFECQVWKEAGIYQRGINERGFQVESSRLVNWKNLITFTSFRNLFFKRKKNSSHYGWPYNLLTIKIKLNVKRPCCRLATLLPNSSWADSCGPRKWFSRWMYMSNILKYHLNRKEVQVLNFTANWQHIHKADTWTVLNCSFLCQDSVWSLKLKNKKTWCSQCEKPQVHVLGLLMCPCELDSYLGASERCTKKNAEINSSNSFGKHKLLIKSFLIPSITYWTAFWWGLRAPQLD